MMNLSFLFLGALIVVGLIIGGIILLAIKK